MLCVGVKKIRPEMLKALDTEGVLWLSRVINLAWQEGIVRIFENGRGVITSTIWASPY